MLKLDSINIEIVNKDISKMVTGVTIYESVLGMLKGAISIKDGINFFDNFIGTSLSPVHIKFQYFEQDPILCSFFMDGISDMKIEKNQKNYIIHIKSACIPQFNETVNSVFSGRSDEIIKRIFTQIKSKNMKLHIDNQTDTKGKYIAPNISAAACFKALMNNAYDVKQTGMFMYQRFFDNNAIRLTSLYNMLNNHFVDNNKVRVAIRSIITSGQTVTGKDIIGTASSFKLKEYNMQLLKKIQYGIWGETIDEIDMDETAIRHNLTQEATSISKTKFKLSDKLYSDDVKSIFSTKGNPTTSKVNNHKIRTFNTLLEVESMVALPNLGVGMSIDVELGESNKSYSRQDGKYLIKNIHHIFTPDAGEFIYTQDLGLVRE
jgi:hypothetical protein